MQKDFLHKVMAERRKDARASRRKVTWRMLEQQALEPRIRRRLTDVWRRLQGETRLPCVIAELKKASPSAGCLRPDYQPAAVAAEYGRAGAAAISVLTEPRHFLGSDEDLRAVRRAVNLPILRKDFIGDAYQVLESAALGADMVLLIAAALEPRRLRALYTFATELGLEAIVEVHNREELERAASLEQAIIGINSRDLVTLKTDLTVARGLAPFLPPGRLCIAESGIRGRRDIEALQALGYQGFLIGESLMRSADVGAQLRALLDAERR